MTQKHRAALCLGALILMGLLGTFFQWFEASSYDKAQAMLGYSGLFTGALLAVLYAVRHLMQRAWSVSLPALLWLHAPAFFLGNALWFMLADLSFMHVADGDSVIPWAVLLSGMGTMAVGASAHLFVCAQRRRFAPA